MCEAKEYPKSQQNIIQLMDQDFRKENLPRKKDQIKQVNQAFKDNGTSPQKEA
jgi:hypothetical protein